MKHLYFYNEEKLVYERIKAKTYIKTALYALAAFALFYTSGLYTGTTKYITQYLKINTRDSLIIHGKPFSEDALIELLKDCNVRYPYIVLAQAKLESGNFTSQVFKENHNLMGMRRARSRMTTATSEKNTYAFYQRWEDCVFDLCLWQAMWLCSIHNEDEYFIKLQEKYAEDPDYVLKLKSVIEKNKLRKIFED